MTGPPDPSACLDLAVLSELRALSQPGEDVLGEVLGLFLGQVPQQLESLRSALEARDRHASHQVAHRLKGSALAMGARQMAAACGLVEQAARDGDLGLAARYAATLDDEFQTAGVALEREVRP